MARISLVVDQETFDSTNDNFDPVPKGIYKCSLFDVKPGEVQSGENKGKLRLNFHWKIADGETSPDGKLQQNRRLFDNINAFSGTNSKTGQPTPPFDLNKIAKGLGYGADALEDLDTDDWLGEELYIVVDHKKKQHQVDGRWVDISPAEFTEKIRGYRSVASMETSAAASETVNATAGTQSSGKKTYALV